MQRVILFNFIVIILMFFASFSFAGTDELESITVIDLRPDRDIALVLLDSGKKQLLKVGDTIPGTNSEVVQVLPDKMIVEAVVSDEELHGKQTVFIYRSETPGGKSKVQQVGHQGYVRKALRLPENNNHK